MPKRPPVFITVSFNRAIISHSRHLSMNFLLQPLKDIAVVHGQTARFECIVQCDPHPYIEWFKNEVPISSDEKYSIEFRNGVCRLTIPHSMKSAI